MRKITQRVIVISTLILLVMTLLVGCGGKAEKKLGWDSNVINKRTEDETLTHSLKASQLNEIATLLSTVYSEKDFDSQEMLVAAWRGYDMLEDGFDDTTGEFPKKETNLKAVRNLLDKANARAKDDAKIDVDYSAISATDVETLIAAMKITVNTSSGSGFFDVLLSGVGVVLRWITNTLGFGNYLIGICIFAILIEILMLPFGIKQQKNSIRQANLRPKEMAIRNKYKGRNDQVTMQKMQEEIQEFYQRENFSPYSGCLPLLIQLPIIMALYYIVIDPLHYVLGQSAEVSAALNSFCSASRAAGGLGNTLGTSNGTIAILSSIKLDQLAEIKNFAYFSNGEAIFESLNSIAGSIPNFNIGPFNFGLNPDFARFDILLLVPVLTFVTYFFTSKLNRKFMAQPASAGGPDERQVACSNNIMDITMPAMSTVFTFMVPALVGIYWIFRSLVGMLKQFILSRVMPLPTFTEEDYKRAAKEMAGKRVVKKSNSVGSVRSLHHIDDEDFEDTRERALARKAAIEERERLEQEERAKKSPFGEAKVKEENKKDTESKTKPEDSENDDNNSN